jgi:hypothetical protein
MSTGVPAAVSKYLLSQLLPQHVMKAAVSACQAAGWLYCVCADVAAVVAAALIAALDAAVASDVSAGVVEAVAVAAAVFATIFAGAPYPLWLHLLLAALADAAVYVSAAMPLLLRCRCCC